jgi:hypothetical protein
MKALKYAALIGLTGLITNAMADTVIDTTLGWDGSSAVAPFGLPDTATYGQTITVPLTDTSLTSFSFEMNQPASDIFKGYVFAWDGLKASGSSLYTSPVMSTSGSGFQEITFNTGGLSLTPGGTYVLFASASEIPASTGTGTWGQPNISNPYSGGGFVFMNNGTDSSQWTTVNWVQNLLGIGGDLAFKASFSPVPEPATLALASLGGLGMLLLRRKR